MTLSLYVLRHAKAAEVADGGDHARPLREDGRQAARCVGAALARLDAAPDVVLSSTAARAQETAELVLRAGGFGAPLVLRRELYTAGAGELLAQVSALEGQPRRVFLVGHQPALSLWIAELSGAEVEFPPCALARLDFERESWSEVVPRAGRLVWLVTSELLARSSAARG
jgi:phosphohistidine phosphatase